MNENAMQELRSLEYPRPLDDLDGDECFRVRGLIESYPFSLQGKKVLEIGTLDGLHACQLASAGAIVTASDIRPRNLQRALYRAMYYGLNNITYRLLDMEAMGAVLKFDEYDLIFHSGCFYHLVNPVAHLREIRGLAAYMLLETHVLDPRYTPGEIEGYKGCWYPEPGWKADMGAKDAGKSFWMVDASLEQLFEDCNLSVVKVIYRHFPNPSGPRNCYLLKREEPKNGGDVNGSA